MANSPRKKPQPGVRGPQQTRSNIARATPATEGARGSFERFSYPFLRTLASMPRWLIVVLPAVLLLGGFIVPIAWLGGLLLLVNLVFIAWLTALSWPAIKTGSRIVRVIVVLALLGVTVLKFMGRF